MGSQSTGISREGDTIHSSAQTLYSCFDEGGDAEFGSVEHAGHDWEQNCDDLSGEVITKHFIHAAMVDETKEVVRSGFGRAVLRAMCLRETHRAPIGTRWVDVDNGLPGAPDVRSRVAAQGLNRCSNKPQLFFATHPCDVITYVMVARASRQSTSGPRAVDSYCEKVARLLHHRKQ